MKPNRQVYYLPLLYLLTKMSLLCNRRPTKKEHIHELISNGEYSDEDNAKIVGTTIPNVWKEKSILRKSGVLVRHRVERCDRTLLVTSGAQAVYGTQSKAAIA